MNLVALGADPSETLLALNNAHARETSWLDRDRLRAMLAAAFHASGDADGGAMLIAFDQDAAYDGLNFLWFRERYPRFVYIDRVIVAGHARGRGWARAMYDDLFARAAAAGHTMVGCEVNLDPPNPGSDAFHHALAFTEVGRARSHDGGKTVRYLVRALGD